jgi:hypothetical protein
MTLKSLEWYASRGTPLLPCPRCGSHDLSGVDDDDCGHIITCWSCKLDHAGAFGEDASRDWNAGSVRSFYGQKHTFIRGRPAFNLSPEGKPA